MIEVPHLLVLLVQGNLGRPWPISRSWVCCSLVSAGTERAG